MSNMSRTLVLVVLAAAFPAILLAQKSHGKPDPTPKPTPPSCNLNTLELQALRNEVTKCFSDVIDTIAGVKKENMICHNVTEFEKKVEFLFTESNRTCSGKFIGSIQSEIFLDMLNTTSKNPDILKDFYNNTCSNQTSAVIHSCYNNRTGVTLKADNFRWMDRLASLYFEGITCDRQRQTEACAIKELQETCPKSAPYLKLMYEVSLKNCPLPSKAPSTADDSKVSGSTTFTAASSTALALITLPLTLVQYLLTYQR